LFGLATGSAGALVFQILAGSRAAFVVGAAIALAAQAVGRVAGISPPTTVSLRIRTGVERFTRGFIIGLIVGVALEFALGLPASQAIASGGAVGLCGGLAAGLAFMLEQTPDVRRAASPRDVLSRDRTALLLRVLVIGPLGGLAVALAIGLDGDLGFTGAERVGIVVGAALGLGAWIVIGLRTRMSVGFCAGFLLGTFGGGISYLSLSQSSAGNSTLAFYTGLCLWWEISLALAFTSAWGRYTSARIWAGLRGYLPWDLMRFLEDAHQRGVLRQVGPVYQFRHTALGERLANGTAPVAPRPRTSAAVEGPRSESSPPPTAH
jgi:hypothetical protein